MSDVDASGTPGTPGADGAAGDPDRPGGSVRDLVELMARLRAPDGCRWDRAQTHESLVRHLVEETSETVEAIANDDPANLVEELGDVLLQVVLHAQIASEQPPGDPGHFDIDDVARGVTAKMVRRHPHVFARPADATHGDGSAAGAAPDGSTASWLALKEVEKPERTSALDGIPPLPALARAEKLLSRLDRGGLAGALPDLVERTGRDATVGRGVIPAAEVELGTRLFALVVEAHAAGLDAERALRATVRAVEHAARALESEGGAGRAPADGADDAAGGGRGR